MKTINIVTQGHAFVKDYRDILVQFFPTSKIFINKEYEGRGTLIIALDKNVIDIRFKGEEIKDYRYTSQLQSQGDEVRQIKKHMVLALTEVTQKNLPWGILTGIRPVKIPHKLIIQGNTCKEVEEYLKKEYFLSTEKASLITDLAQVEISTMYPIKPYDTMLYIGIPFCPSRCYYCSFISQVSVGYEDLVSDYFIALLKETEAILAFLKERKVRIRCIYIGGGTPTVLDSRQIEKLFSLLYKYIPWNQLKEVNFEAGRPETIHKDNLMVLKNYGVHRICINTQTLKNDTLKRIGRKHTAQDFYRAMEVAQGMGFDTINTDLILGLEGENVKDIQNNIQKIIQLKPENITIHNLSLKKSSILHQEDKFLYQSNELICKMNEKVKEALKQNQYSPYYLYRQKYAQGNLENAGYALKGKEGFYNIGIMSEKISIIGLGAGSSGKLFYPEEDRLERLETVKNSKVYINNVEQICLKKISLMRKLW
ncbi:MAG: coproporphyrinogen dehydrogenase HemZ [Eubacteriales bacterium]